MKRITKISALILVDILCINIAYIIALLLRFEFDVSSNQFNHYMGVYLDNFIIITAVKILIFGLFGLYNSLWRYAGVEEVAKVLFSAVVSFIIVFIFLRLTHQVIPRGVQGICLFLDIILIGGSRLSYRYIRSLNQPGNFFSKVFYKKDFTKVLIVGAGDAGASMIKEIRQNPDTGKYVVAVIDDDPQKIGRRIVGKKIVGNRNYIAKAVKKYGIDEIIIAIPSASKRQIQGIVNECNKTDCKVKILPAYIDLIDGKVSINKLRDVQIEDLLGRDPVSVNLSEISGYLEGKNVMVTGGGGSIGSELCRQISRFKPRRLIALDIYENSIYILVDELKRKYPELHIEPVICSVRNKQRLEEVFIKYKPHIVFHAAAHKHVPLMEANPKEAVLNNILGTKNIVDLSHDYLVENFVLISTDKAVNPANVMGATKRVAEMIIQEKSYHSRTCFSAVRFGNVLGSNGSVLPLFRKQIEMGGPVTVTHEDITRYFMTIPEAVQLVIQAGAMAKGGEIFVLDMGDAVKIIDLAENVIRMSGFVPYVDIDIEITGLRPGEKLYEELLLDEEGIENTSHDNIFVAKPVKSSPALHDILSKGDDYLGEVIEDICKKDDKDVKEWLHEVVPNYRNNNL
ncbi:MAG: polysaccharide biosynthesis protein [Clostridiales bacterium]|nr:polysaccharide biosynthesis protein [Clostridiales bacterium]